MQANNGSMPAGHNGPHRDFDTPVRNTAHWLIIFLKAHEYTQKDYFKDSAIQAAQYLLSKEARPMRGAFLCRYTRGKDSSNGLIGQAWVIEALALASGKLKIAECGDIAREVFLMHVFSEERGFWFGLNVNGERLPLNETFNQQLWFALSGIMLLENTEPEKEIERAINLYFQYFIENLQIDKRGLIYHYANVHPSKEKKGKISPYRQYQYLKKKIYGVLPGKDCIRLDEPSVWERSVGYHSFILYALAVIKKEKGDIYNKIWQSNEFHKSLAFVQTKRYISQLANNRYAFQYNPVGFEIGFVEYIFPHYFSDQPAAMGAWIHKQIARHYSLEEGLMCKNTIDPYTLSARIYEAARLPNIEINI